MCGAVSDIEACIPALRRHVSALLRDRRGVDDLVRACLAQALERDGAPDGQTDARIRLFAILYDLLGNRPWRGRVRRASRPASQDGPDALARLDQLADQQRAVLLLVSIEDLTYQEVAEILGISLAAVMSLLADGREHLRRLGVDTADADRRRMDCGIVMLRFV